MIAATPRLSGDARQAEIIPQPTRFSGLFRQGSGCPLCPQQRTFAAMVGSPLSANSGHDLDQCIARPRKQKIVKVAWIIKFPFQRALRDADRENGEGP